MYIEQGKSHLFNLIKNQLSNFFVLNDQEKEVLYESFDQVLERVERCFSQTKNKYYKKQDLTYFNPFHSGQYCIYLYFFSNTLSRKNFKLLADKVYGLNKALHACDIYHEVELPDVFFLDHPVGSVLGRATYGNGFSFGQ